MDMLHQQGEVVNGFQREWMATGRSDKIHTSIEKTIKHQIHKKNPQKWGA